MDLNLQPLLDLLVQAMSALIVPVAITGGAILAQKWKLNAAAIKSKTLEDIKISISVAILAAEQKQKAGKLGSTGADKKSYATESIKRSLERKKIKIDPVDLDELIDAQVWGELTAPAMGIPKPLEPQITYINKPAERG